MSLTFYNQRRAQLAREQEEVKKLVVEEPSVIPKKSITVEPPEELKEPEPVAEEIESAVEEAESTIPEELKEPESVNVIGGVDTEESLADADKIQGKRGRPKKE